MFRSIRILLACWTSAAFLLSGCAGRAPSLRMLDTRAVYNSPYDDEEVALYQKARSRGAAIGRPIGPRITKVYVYPHELPSQDYFWGGFISLVIRRDEIVFDPPADDEGETPANEEAALHTKLPVPKKFKLIKAKGRGGSNGV